MNLVFTLGIFANIKLSNIIMQIMTTIEFKSKNSFILTIETTIASFSDLIVFFNLFVFLLNINSHNNSMRQNKKKKKKKKKEILFNCRSRLFHF